mmetsp:Transcript_16869/g.43175  ORF Transcript_16869/g.43175 Transcript_16869/m.43175 type:complete len:157 (-) Transcript_16869:162-632(-)
MMAVMAPRTGCSFRRFIPMNNSYRGFCGGVHRSSSRPVLSRRSSPTVRLAIFGPSENERKLERQVTTLQAEKDTLEQRLKETRNAMRDAQEQLAKAVDTSDMRKRRLDEAEKEVFKLERALEEKDNTLESFAATARRTIADLDKRLKEAQQQQKDE